MFAGTAPSVEKPIGDYPHVVNKANGERTLVVQDYTFGKYLGFLQVQFDNTGKVVSYGGNPIILNNITAEGTKSHQMLTTLKKSIIFLWFRIYKWLRYEISITCKAKTKLDKISFWSIFQTQYKWNPILIKSLLFNKWMLLCKPHW